VLLVAVAVEHITPTEQERLLEVLGAKEHSLVVAVEVDIMILVRHLLPEAVLVVLEFIKVGQRLLT